MKEYLSSIVPSLKKISKTLDKQSILIDKPWSLIDSDFEQQKLIFKKNKELILSKNGKVTIGSWEYLAEAKALLIDRGDDKILCNEAFIDDAVLVLVVDGTSNNFFILANENKLPDLDAYSYLRTLFYNQNNIQAFRIDDNRMLEIKKLYNRQAIYIDDIVTIDQQEVKSGTFRVNQRKYIVEKSRLKQIIYEVPYKTKDGLEVIIEQLQEYNYFVGQNVWLDNQKAPDGKYRIKGGQNIIVENGIIIKKTIF